MRREHPEDYREFLLALTLRLLIGAATNRNELCPFICSFISHFLAFYFSSDSKVKH